MHEIPWLTVCDIGLALGIALLAGIVAERFQIPDVTAFLLTGLALGPHGVALLREHDLVVFEPLAKAAMALVLFEIGCQFTLRRFRAQARRIARISPSEILVTAGIVTIGMTLLAGADWKLGLLLGVLAVATAPATTMLVLQEAESEGPVTEYAITLIVLNNLVCLLAFELVLTALLFFADNDTAGSRLAWELLLFVRDIAGSLLLGVLAGLLVTFFSGLVHHTHWFVLLIAITLGTLGLASHFEMPYLLTFFTMGATVTNTTEEAGSLVNEVKHLTGLLCVIFFVTHGAEMDIRALVQAGLLGVAYIGLRSAGKYAGARLGAGAAGCDRNVRRWLGLALLAQAGTALALVGIASERTAGIDGLQELAAQAKTVILGTVIVFELVGPILTKLAVVRAGEVPVAHAIRHVTTTPVDELRSLGRRAMEAIGLRKQVVAAANVPIRELMRRTFRALPVAASFDEIVHTLHESHQNTFPVVDSQNRLVGLIRYDDLKDVLFDPDLGDLVRADDLAVSPPLVLKPDTPLRDVWHSIRGVKDDLIPVTADDGTLVGILRTRDVLRLVLQAGQDEGTRPTEAMKAVETAPTSDKSKHEQRLDGRQRT